MTFVCVLIVVVGALAIFTFGVAAGVCLCTRLFRQAVDDPITGRKQ